MHSDIVLVKLKPGQSIHLEIYACKGTAVTHAKFSPVCPASYRMHPQVCGEGRGCEQSGPRCAQVGRTEGGVHGGTDTLGPGLASGEGGLRRA